MSWRRSARDGKKRKDNWVEKPWRWIGGLFRSWRKRASGMFVCFGPCSPVAARNPVIAQLRSKLCCKFAGSAMQKLRIVLEAVCQNSSELAAAARQRSRASGQHQACWFAHLIIRTNPTGSAGRAWLLAFVWDCRSNAQALKSRC